MRSDYGKSKKAKTYRLRKNFPKVARMAVDYYEPDDFQKVEDRLQDISLKIREIRQQLQAGPLEKARLNFGTFLHYVGELEQLALKYAGEFRAQHAAKKLQEEKKAKAKNR